jgi:hypothetical protein
MEVPMEVPRQSHWQDSLTWPESVTSGSFDQSRLCNAVQSTKRDCLLLNLCTQMQQVVGCVLHSCPPHQQREERFNAIAGYRVHFYVMAFVFARQCTCLSCADLLA